MFWKVNIVRSSTIVAGMSIKDGLQGRAEIMMTFKLSF